MRESYLTNVNFCTKQLSESIPMKIERNIFNMQKKRKIIFNNDIRYRK